VFDLMGADPRIDDARWLLDWIGRTGHQQFTRRDAHHAAPRSRLRKAADLDPPGPAGGSTATCAAPTQSPPATHAAAGGPPRPASSSAPSTHPQKPQNPRKPVADRFLWILWFLWTPTEAPNEGSSARPSGA
jgi:hypothetical protein